MDTSLVVELGTVGKTPALRIDRDGNVSVVTFAGRKAEGLRKLFVEMLRQWA